MINLKNNDKKLIIISIILLLLVFYICINFINQITFFLIFTL